MRELSIAIYSFDIRLDQSHLVSVRTNRDTEGACQTKVSQLDVATRVDEQILRLQIAVHNAARVAVVQTNKDLVNVALTNQTQTTTNRPESDRNHLFQTRQINFVSISVHTRIRVGLREGTESMNFFKSWSKYSNTNQSLRR